MSRAVFGIDSLASRASFAGCCARICFTSIGLGKLLAIDSLLISFDNDMPINQELTDAGRKRRVRSSAFSARSFSDSCLRRPLVFFLQLHEVSEPVIAGLGGGSCGFHRCIASSG
jgi:hypothetical protein